MAPRYPAPLEFEIPPRVVQARGLYTGAISASSSRPDDFAEQYKSWITPENAPLFRSTRIIHQVFETIGRSIQDALPCDVPVVSPHTWIIPEAIRLIEVRTGELVGETVPAMETEVEVEVPKQVPDESIFSVRRSDSHIMIGMSPSLAEFAVQGADSLSSHSFSPLVVEESLPSESVVSESEEKVAQLPLLRELEGDDGEDVFVQPMVEDEGPLAACLGQIRNEQQVAALRRLGAVYHHLAARKPPIAFNLPKLSGAVGQVGVDNRPNFGLSLGGDGWF
jgi:hypothetical protein